MAEKKFETALARLEEIVEDLEKGEQSLEQSFKLFEEGIKLARLCNAKLEAVEGKVEILTRERSGALTLKPFEDEDEA